MKTPCRDGGLLPMLIRLGQGKQAGVIPMPDERSTADLLLPWSAPSDLSTTASRSTSTLVTKVRAETTDDS